MANPYESVFDLVPMSRRELSAHQVTKLTIKPAAVGKFVSKPARPTRWQQAQKQRKAAIRKQMAASHAAYLKRNR